MFRVAQEAIRNAAKHADPSRIEVRVSRSSDYSELIVEDDGRGLPPELAANGAAEGHFGLQMLHDLTAEAGATLEIDPNLEGAQASACEWNVHDPGRPG